MCRRSPAVRKKDWSSPSHAIVDTLNKLHFTVIRRNPVFMTDPYFILLYFYFDIAARWEKQITKIWKRLQLVQKKTKQTMSLVDWRGEMKDVHVCGEGGNAVTGSSRLLFADEPETDLSGIDASVLNFVWTWSFLHRRTCWWACRTNRYVRLTRREPTSNDPRTPRDRRWPFSLRDPHVREDSIASVNDEEWSDRSHWCYHDWTDRSNWNYFSS